MRHNIVIQIWTRVYSEAKGVVLCCVLSNTTLIYYGTEEVVQTTEQHNSICTVKVYLTMWPCDATADQIAIMSLLPLAQ